MNNKIKEQDLFRFDLDFRSAIAKDVVKTKFVDVPRIIVIGDGDMQIVVKGVDHYWGKAGMVMMAAVGSKPIGLGIHPNFRIPMKDVNTSNFYESIDSISVVVMSNSSTKRMRKHIRSQGIDVPFTRNRDRRIFTEYHCSIAYSSDLRI